MAKTPFHALVKNGQTYTVPSGKYAIFSAFSGVSVSPFDLFLNGVFFAVPASSGANYSMPGQPLAAKAGDVLSIQATNGEEASLVGFLLDA